jgi:predicted RNase H-like HicB family nuclease
MSLRFQLEYWRDGEWFVGRLPHVPSVFSQGATLEELEANIRDADRMMLDEHEGVPHREGGAETKEIEVRA